MGAELITSWTYKNGELTRQKMDSWILGIATIASLVLTFTIAWPLTHTSIPFAGKLNKWLLLFVFFGIAVVLYYILRFFSGSLFKLYSAIAGVQVEEILFTNQKITSTNKTWILNDEIRKLTAIHFTEEKNKALIFTVTENQPGKNPVKHTINIPVPVEEDGNAAKVYTYFEKARISTKAIS